MYSNLIAEIARSGQDQHTVAKNLGIHRNTLNAKLYERNNAKFHLDEVEKLLDMFPGNKFEYLFERTNKKKEK